MGPAEAPNPAPWICVEVVWAPGPGRVDCTPLRLAAGSTVADALRASGVLQRDPACAGADQRVGVWGRLCETTQVLRDADRVELYRPLTVDPKEARRRRQQGQPARRAPPPRRARGVAGA